MNHKERVNRILESKKEIKELVNKYGLADTARLLGYDITHPENLEYGGVLLYDVICSLVPQNVKLYIERASRMRYHVKQFFLNHSSEIESIIQKYPYSPINWFSCGTLTKTYLWKNVYSTLDDNVMSSITGLIETPELMYMRIAVELYHDDSENPMGKIENCYQKYIEGYLTQASPKALINSRISI